MVDSSVPVPAAAARPLAPKRRTFLAGAASATVLALLPGFLRPVPASADGPGDYPEYPYPTTELGAYDELYRGQFHFSSRIGWLNDINAPLYYKGVYHMFYQHNPHGLAWDTMHWGHATSPDLVHWTQQAVALEPGVQPGNLWSGAGVVDTGNVTGLASGTDAPIVVFTGTGGALMDYSTDGARTFTSYGNGRIVAALPASSTESRDPKVLWDEARGRWAMVMYSHENGKNGYDFFTSENLLDWAYASRFEADWAFECPDLYPMAVDGGSTVKWVLNAASTKYVVGDFDGTRFTTDWTAPVQMDQGTNAYAGQVYNDVPGGRIVADGLAAGQLRLGVDREHDLPCRVGARDLPRGAAGDPHPGRRDRPAPGEPARRGPTGPSPPTRAAIRCSASTATRTRSSPCSTPPAPPRARSA